MLVEFLRTELNLHDESFVPKLKFNTPSLDFHPLLNMVSKNGMTWLMLGHCSVSQKSWVLVINDLLCGGGLIT